MAAGSSLAQMFADAISGENMGLTNNNPTSSESGSSHTGVDCRIIEYIQFLHSVKSSLNRKEFLGLGLTLGVVTKLFDNVSKFEKYLAKNKQ